MVFSVGDNIVSVLARQAPLSSSSAAQTKQASLTGFIQVRNKLLASDIVSGLSLAKDKYRFSWLLNDTKKKLAECREVSKYTKNENIWLQKVKNRSTRVERGGSKLMIEENMSKVFDKKKNGRCTLGY